MAVTTSNLGFAPKGRPTIRKHTPSGRTPRYIEPWALRPKARTTLPSRRAGSALKRNALLCPQGYEDGGWRAKVEIDVVYQPPLRRDFSWGRTRPRLQHRLCRIVDTCCVHRVIAGATPGQASGAEGHCFCPPPGSAFVQHRRPPQPTRARSGSRHQCQSVRPRRTAAASRPIGSRASTRSARR